MFMDPFTMALIGIGGSAGMSALQSAMSMNAASVAGGDSYHYTKKLQEQAERFNADQAQITRDYNAQQAQITRSWQEKLANSAFQRSRVDLEKANLNPLLALTNPSATPSGATASASSASVGSGSVSQPSADMSSIGKFGQQVGAIMSGLAQASADVENTLSDSALKGVQAEESSARASLAEAQKLKVMSETKLNTGKDQYPGLLGDSIRSLKSLATDKDLVPNIYKGINTAMDRPMSTAKAVAENISSGLVGSTLTRSAIEHWNDTMNSAKKFGEFTRRVMSDPEAKKQRHQRFIESQLQGRNPRSIYGH